MMKLVIRMSVAVLAVAATLSLGYVVLEKELGLGKAYAAALEIGKPLPDFALTDSTGKEHKLADYKGKVLVINFSSPNCPFSKGADTAINALAEKYKDAAFLGIDSNKNVTADDLNKHIAASKQPYPIAKDPENKYADAVGAKVTPELFIVGKDGNLAYHGAPDNRTSPDGEPTEQYADAALKALSEGKPVEKTEVSAWGCGIKRVK
jgi:thiol-disulfide isomerase/thioredoxin